MSCTLHERNPALICVTHDDLAFAFSALEGWCPRGVELSDNDNCELVSVYILVETGVNVQQHNTYHTECGRELGRNI